MNTISFDELKQIVGELFVENILLKKKITYLEDMIQQLILKEEGEVTVEEKEVKLQPLPGD